MQMIPVASRNISSVGYDPDARTLRIQFHTSIIEYYQVPKSIYEGLLKASSKGSFHHQHIKNVYEQCKFA